MNNIDLSIFVLAYNECETLYNCIDDIYASVSSIGCKYEIIIVDDGSQDDTAKVIEKIIQDFPGPD